MMMHPESVASRRRHRRQAMIAVSATGLLAAAGIAFSQLSSAHAAPAPGAGDQQIQAPANNQQQQGPIPVAPPNNGNAQSSTVDNLTPAEWSFCRQDLIKCHDAVDSKDFAFANYLQVAGLTQGIPNDKGDAARHCLWQLSLSAFYDTTYAEQWGNTHEQNNDAAETHAMDLHNNVVARSMINDPTLQQRIAEFNAIYSAPDPAGNPPVVSPQDRDIVKAQIVRLCTAAISNAVQVTYAPNASSNVADQVNPDPQDRFVYLAANP